MRTEAKSTTKLAATRANHFVCLLCTVRKSNPMVSCAKDPAKKTADAKEIQLEKYKFALSTSMARQFDPSWGKKVETKERCFCPSCHHHHHDHDHNKFTHHDCFGDLSYINAPNKEIGGTSQQTNARAE
eukprot:scaffold267_cov192-Amphora_coffeaeformis.AAC.5